MPRWTTLPGSRRIRPPLALTAAALTLTAAAVGGDRLVAVWAEHATAAAFQEATGATDTPSVHIGGFPVTRQLLAGHLDRVTLHAGEIPAAGDRPVPLTRLDLRMTDVRAESDPKTARAATVDGTALLSYADLSRALGVQVGADRAPGRVDVSTDLPLLGKVSASATLTVAGPTSIAFHEVDLDAHLPAPADAALVQAVEQPITLQDLPAGMKVTRVRVDSAGVRGVLTGRDVTFTPQEQAGQAV